MTQQESLKKFALAVIADMQNEQQKKGIRASGRSSDSLRDESGANFTRVIGAHTFEFQEFGRRPGTRPPPGRLEQWILDKGILSGSVNDSKVKSLAYIIGENIEKRGTRIYRDASPKLGIQEILERNLSTLQEELREFNRTNVRSDVLRGLEQALNG